MAFTLISTFLAKRVRKGLVLNGFYTNFSILGEGCDTVFSLESFLD